MVELMLWEGTKRFASREAATQWLGERHWHSVNENDWDWEKLTMDRPVGCGILLWEENGREHYDFVSSWHRTER